MTAYAIQSDFSGGLAGVPLQLWSQTRAQSRESRKIFTASKDSYLNFLEPLTRHSLYHEFEKLDALLKFNKERLPSNTYERFLQRLRVLFDPADWDNNDKFPNIESFLATLDFLSNNKNLHMPTLSLNRNGHFILAWRPARDKLLSLIFEPNDEVSWLVYFPNPKKTDGIDDTAGQTTSDRAMSLVKNFGVSEWIYRPSLVANTFNAIWRRIT